MSGKNKKHNSIIFLTTLSVYLSLSLLGAAPQVLAYAATTRDFDIRTEIEYQDDLDNKPDGELEENSADNFPRTLFDFLGQIKNETANGRIQLPLPVEFGSSGYTKIFEEGSGQSSGYESNSRIDDLCDQFIGQILKNSIKSADYKWLFNTGVQIGKVKQTDAKIRANKSDLIFEVSFSRSNAEAFADYLNARYASLAKNTEETRLKKFYENTEINVENNQVFIVTRLPRAAIDSLIQ